MPKNTKFSQIFKELEAEISAREELDLAFELNARPRKSGGLASNAAVQKRAAHLGVCLQAGDRGASRKAAMALIVATAYVAWSANKEVTDPQLLLPIDEGYVEEKPSEEELEQVDMGQRRDEKAWAEKSQTAGGGDDEGGDPSGDDGPDANAGQEPEQEPVAASG